VKIFRARREKFSRGSVLPSRWGGGKKIFPAIIFQKIFKECILSYKIFYDFIEILFSELARKKNFKKIVKIL